MRLATLNKGPSLTSDLGAIAGLYRTVFWMMGRKSRYGRIWPPEAEMGVPEEAAGTTELYLAAQSPELIGIRQAEVEAGARG